MSSPSTARAVTIYDHRGQVVSPRAIQRAKILGGGSMYDAPYDSGDIYSAEMREWRPYLWSPDTALNPNRDRIVSRVRDMVTNDGWASGAVTRVLDNAIGPNFRPIPKPNHRWLHLETGDKKFDAVWAHEYATWARARFESWADDAGKWADIERNLTFSQMQYLAFRHKIVDGDALAMMRWEPSRMGYGLAQYCTAVQVIDPDRLSNPMNQYDMRYRRGGVEIDDFGAAVGYHVRDAHQGDWYNADLSLHWTYVPRETRFGRAIMVHDYEKDRAGQHRGGAGILSPVLKRLKMLVKYDSAELEAAVVNSIFGAYLESPFDHTLLQDALGEENALLGYQDQRYQFHKDKNISVGGVKIPTFFPGEKLSVLDAARPTGNFEGFEGAVLRNVASGLGLSAQQVSQNWSDVNYSSARAALLEAWKTMDRRRAGFVAGFSHPIYICALEEFHDSDRPPLPSNAPDFIEARNAYSRARWIGPAKGWVDPVAEREGAWLGMEMGIDTLEDQAADQGRYWLDDLDQRQIEVEAYRVRGLTPPSWQGASPRGSQNTPANDPPPPKMPSAPKPGKESDQ